jgi:hypothetical protein
MTKANIVLAAAAVVFGAGCFVLFKDTIVQRNRVRALEAQVAQLHREMMADTTASQSVTSDTAAPTSERPAQAAAHPPLQSSTPAVTKPAPAANNEWRAVLADPAYRRARLAEARLELQRGYPQIVSELGLSADEAERFLDLLAEQSLRENEWAMKKQPGQDPMEWRRELYAQAENERRAFLGEERFGTWVEYVKSAEARAFVNDLRTPLATTSSPLREEQVKPLVNTLATEHERHAEERQENYKAETNGGGQWTEATPAAQQIAYMERRAALIEESLDRQQEAGEMYLDSVQQREFNAMLDRRREQARVELDSFQAQLEAAERTRSR